MYECATVDQQQVEFQELSLIADKKYHFRFYSIDEISEGSAYEYRAAMANVIANVSQNNSSMIYLLSGTPQGIKLYIGVAGDHAVSDDGKLLRSSFEGNFVGSKLTDIKSDDTALSSLLDKTKHVGLVTGVPSFNESKQGDEDDFQGVERLAKTLSDVTWQMIIVAEPGSDDEIRESLDSVYEFSTLLSGYVKHSIQQSENSGWNKSSTVGTSESSTTGTSESDTRGKSTGTNKSDSKSKNNSNNGSISSSSAGTSNTWATSDGKSESHAKSSNRSDTKGESRSDADGKSGGEGRSLTRERIDKRIEQIQSHLNDQLVPRHYLGQSKGMFRTAIYLCAENQATYHRLTGSVRSIFQGTEATLSPLQVTKLSVDRICLNDLLSIKKMTHKALTPTQVGSAIIHGTPLVESDYCYGGTWLNTHELSLLTGLPSEELPGITLRKSVSFAVNTLDEQQEGQSIKLGKVVQDGRILQGKDIQLSKDNLNKHVFVTGVTGAGKTTTCMKLLLESGFPFLVLEPAKTEYRALHGHVSGIQYYSLGREDLTTFRLNPFELVSPRQNLTGHVSMLKSTMTAVFQMEASMPAIVEQAIIKSYENKGWDIASSTNYYVDDPWNTRDNVWPTFSDMINELEGVIKSAGMGTEFEEKYQGSLVSRLSALTKGIKGTMINTTHSMDFNRLLENKVIIELEELKDEEDKAFFMALIIGRISECIKNKHREDHTFKHMTLIEEAHRLLSKPEPGADGSKAMGVEMFANLLAEVRKYGESLIIADQIPNKLISDIIKNTNIKIIHRLFAADDRNTIGDAIGLSQEQKDFLPLLQPGETIVYSGGWHAPVRAQIDQLANTNAKEISEQEIAKIGEEQLFSQRKVLFPQLDVHSVLKTPATFAQFVRDGRRVINMMIKAVQLFDQNKIMAERVAHRMQKTFIQLQEDLELSNEAYSDMLTALCIDSLTPAWDLDSQELLYKVMQNNVIPALVSHSQAFMDLLSSKAMATRDFRVCFISGSNHPLMTYTNI